jgi:hypothetical protein
MKLSDVPWANTLGIYAKDFQFETTDGRKWELYLCANATTGPPLVLVLYERIDPPPSVPIKCPFEIAMILAQAVEPDPPNENGARSTTS